MGSRHHHSHSHHGRRRGPSAGSLIWLILAGVLVSGLLIGTVGGEQPIPEAPPRRYPGTPGSHKSQILPRNAREASEHFHRTYDDVDTVYQGDRRSSRTERRTERPKNEAQPRQQKASEQKPARPAPKQAPKPAPRPRPAPAQKR